MNLEEIKGIGPKTIELLNKLNITTIEDLLSYYPYRYDYLIVTNLLNCIDTGYFSPSIVANKSADEQNPCTCLP